MKIKCLLIGMLACTALVGCSSEDDVINNNVNENGEKYYMAVSFSMPGGTSSRTVTDTDDEGNYEYVDAESNNEVAINNVTFYFLNAAGNSVADACYLPKTDNLTWDTTDYDDTPNNIDEQTSAVIVLKNATEYPSSILAVINTGDLETTLTKKPTLTQIQDVIANYATSSYTDMPNSGMVMSSSVYKNAAGQFVYGAPVSVANIYTDSEGKNWNVGDEAPTEMDDMIVNVPVEKVLAKVSVTNSIAETKDNSYSVTDKNENGDGLTSSQITFNIVPTGWWLDSAPTLSYLLKNTNFTLSTNWWNDATNFRSYWAKSVETNQAYTNWAWNDKKDMTSSLYCQENTVNVTATTQENDNNDNVYEVNNRTKVVVAAELQKGTGDDAETVSLVKWLGKYYTEEGFMYAFANMQEVRKYYTYDETTKVYTSLTADKLQIVSNTDITTGDNASTTGEITNTNQNNWSSNGEEIRNYEAIVQLADEFTSEETEGEETTTATKLYTEGENGNMVEVTDLTAVNTYLAKYSKIMFWKDGKTYYYVEIEHNNAEDAQYGIVRNHLYKLTLTGINGLGTPVPDPDKIIIPEKPEDGSEETYIAARIQILSYRVVNQSVTLE